MARTKRLFNAVDKFAATMKARLAKKAELGYSGWNNKDSVSDTHLIHGIIDKAQELRNKNIMCVEPLSKKDLVDIANFAMMLHRRC